MASTARAESVATADDDSNLEGVSCCDKGDMVIVNSTNSNASVGEFTQFDFTASKHSASSSPKLALRTSTNLNCMSKVDLNPLHSMTMPLADMPQSLEKSKSTTTNDDEILQSLKAQLEQVTQERDQAQRYALEHQDQSRVLLHAIGLVSQLASMDTAILHATMIDTLSRTNTHYALPLLDPLEPADEPTTMSRVADRRYNESIFPPAGLHQSPNLSHHVLKQRHGNNDIISHDRTTPCTDNNSDITLPPFLLKKTAAQIQQELDLLQKSWRLEDTPLSSLLTSIYTLHSHLHHLQLESDHFSSTLQSLHSSLLTQKSRTANLESSLSNVLSQNAELKIRLKMKKIERKSFVKTVRNYVAIVRSTKKREEELDVEERHIANRLRVHEGLLKLGSYTRRESTLNDDGAVRQRTLTSDSFSELDDSFDCHLAPMEHEEEATDSFAGRDNKAHRTYNYDFEKSNGGVYNNYDENLAVCKAVTLSDTDQGMYTGEDAEDKEETSSLLSLGSSNSTASSSRSLVTDEGIATVRFTAADNKTVQNPRTSDCNTSNDATGHQYQAKEGTSFGWQSMKAAFSMTERKSSHVYTLRFPIGTKVGLQFQKVSLPKIGSDVAPSTLSRELSPSLPLSQPPPRPCGIKKNKMLSSCYGGTTAFGSTNSNTARIRASSDGVVTNNKRTRTFSESSLPRILGEDEDEERMCDTSQAVFRNREGAAIEESKGVLLTFKSISDKAVSQLERREVSHDSTDTCGSSSLEESEITPDYWFVVCGFKGFDTSLNPRPTIGARLIAVDGKSLEKSKWTMNDIRAAIQSRANTLTPGGSSPEYFTMCFRNDSLSASQRTLLDKAVSAADESEKTSNATVIKSDRKKDIDVRSIAKVPTEKDNANTNGVDALDRDGNAGETMEENPSLFLKLENSPGRSTPSESLNPDDITHKEKHALMPSTVISKYCVNSTSDDECSKLSSAPVSRQTRKTSLTKDTLATTADIGKKEKRFSSSLFSPFNVGKKFEFQEDSVFSKNLGVEAAAAECRSTSVRLASQSLLTKEPEESLTSSLFSMFSTTTATKKADVKKEKLAPLSSLHTARPLASFADATTFPNTLGASETTTFSLPFLAATTSNNTKKEYSESSETLLLALDEPKKEWSLSDKQASIESATVGAVVLPERRQTNANGDSCKDAAVVDTPSKMSMRSMSFKFKSLFD